MNDNERFAGSLRGEESHIANAEEREEMYMLHEALARQNALLDSLTYNHYRWQREYYGVAAARLAAHYPLAKKYEEQYQAEIARRAA